MSSSNINIRVKTQAEKATSALGGLTKGMRDLSKQGNNLSKTMTSVVNGLGGIKRLSQGLGFHKTASSASAFAKVAMDIQESVHMFNVSMGEFAESTGESVDNLSELTGIDHTTMLDTVGEYNLLARSMGMASDNAQVLSENTNKLALDLSALTNREYSKVAEDLRSGLIGQARTMYKYGVDVTEAAIQQEALNQGITKSVRLMGQGEKMALRYSVIMKQTGLAHGDFAETAHTAANQMRILQSRLLELSRSIGTIFLPIVEKIMPYLNAMVKAFNEVAKAIARIMGYTGEMAQVENTSSDFGIEDLTDDTEEATKKVKELRQQLMGFDEINLYREDKGEGPLDEIEDSLGGADFELEGYDNKLTKMDQRTEEIFNSIIDSLNKLREAAQPTTDALKNLWDDGLSQLRDFAGENLINFYNEFLKPMGKYILGENGLPRLFNILNEMFNNFNWDKITQSLKDMFKALVPFGEFVVDGLLDFVEFFLVPVQEWKFNVGLDRLAKVVTRLAENIDWDNLNEKLVDFWKALAEIKIVKMEIMLWFVENVIEPILEWTGNFLVPAMLDLLTESLKTLKVVIVELWPLWEEFWEETLSVFGIDLGDGIIKSIEKLTQWMINYRNEIKKDPEAFREKARSFFKTAKWIGMLVGSAVGLTKVSGWVGGLTYKMMGLYNQVKLFDLLRGGLPGLGGAGDVAKKTADALVGNPDDVRSQVMKSLRIVGKDGVRIEDGVKLSPFKISTEDVMAITSPDEIVKPGVLTAVSNKFLGVFAPLTTRIGAMFSKLSPTISSAFSIPGVKIIAIAGLIAAAAYVVYDNWDKVKEVFKNLGEVVKPLLEGISEQMSRLWNNVLSPLWEALKPVVMELLGILSELFGYVLKALSWLIKIFGPFISAFVENELRGIVFILEVIVGVVAGLLKILEGILKMIRGIISLDLSVIGEGFTTVLEGILETLKGVFMIIPKYINKIWEDTKTMWDAWKTALPKAFTDIMESVENFGKNLLNRIKEWFANFNLGKMVSDKIKESRIHTMTSGISSRLTKLNPFSMNMTQPVNMSYTPIPELADGGIVDAGQMFIANEAGPEMVGKYGSKTGVINNEQIVNAVSEGVYKAVTSASMEDRGGGGDNEAVMNIDGRELARVILPHMNREGKRQGYKPILNY